MPRHPFVLLPSNFNGVGVSARDASAFRGPAHDIVHSRVGAWVCTRPPQSLPRPLAPEQTKCCCFARSTHVGRNCARTLSVLGAAFSGLLTRFRTLFRRSRSAVGDTEWDPQTPIDDTTEMLAFPDSIITCLGAMTLAAALARGRGARGAWSSVWVPDRAALRSSLYELRGGAGRWPRNGERSAHGGASASEVGVGAARDGIARRGFACPPRRYCATSSGPAVFSAASFHKQLGRCACLLPPARQRYSSVNRCARGV